MRNISEKFLKKFYSSEEHPYRIYEATIQKYIREDGVILDAGCGKSAAVLKAIIGNRNFGVGLDIGSFNNLTDKNKRISLINNNLSKISIKDGSIDMVISRSVFEHLEKPEKAYSEICRILKPEGFFILLTPNLFDYSSLLSKIIPNRFHSKIVKITEGRNEDDTFPAYYKTNTRNHIAHLSKLSGLRLISIKMLGQYPSYFLFNPFLFLTGVAYDKIIGKINLLSFLRGWILAVLKKDS
ncbi:class I SAM-dependent methyltransferase [Thermodesulfobacteriota bacterium]